MGHKKAFLEKKKDFGEGENGYVITENTYPVIRNDNRFISL